jgi:hypothetical protein
MTRNVTRNAAPLMLAIALAAGLGTFAGSARGETVVVDDQLSIAPSDVTRPAAGMTMQKVEARFGAPAERHAAVGAPAITRWDYQNFAVFFEGDRVIHAVVTNPDPGSPDSGAAQAPGAPAAQGTG